MNIALIAHDNKKETLINFSIAYKELLQKHDLFATGTTGKKISEATDLKITRFLSGPLGGDQQIGAMIAKEEMDMIIFLRDPLTAQSHEPDIQALIRVCDVHYVPIATNLASAEIFIKSLENGELNWRNVRKKGLFK